MGASPRMQKSLLVEGQMGHVARIYKTVRSFVLFRLDLNPFKIIRIISPC